MVFYTQRAMDCLLVKSQDFGIGLVLFYMQVISQEEGEGCILQPYKVLSKESNTHPPTKPLKKQQGDHPKP